MYKAFRILKPLSKIVREFLFNSEKDLKEFEKINPNNYLTVGQSPSHNHDCIHGFPLNFYTLKFDCEECTNDSSSENRPSKKRIQ